MNYEEQIMSKDKYPSIFSPQMEAIVFIILQIFYATRAVLKIGKYPRIFPSFSWGIGSLSTRVFETWTATGREQFAFLDRIVSQIFILFISNEEKILSNVNVVV